MLVLSDRVKESSLSSGSGSITFAGAFRGFQTFASGIGDGNVTYYTIEHGRDYEIGVGTYSSGNNTLSRDLVLESSNNDELINLIDSSIIFCTYPAKHSVFLNQDGYISGQLPYYSGIAFPDGTFQTTSLDGTGSENKIAYWQDANTLSSIENIAWNSNANNLHVSGNISVIDDFITSGNAVFYSDVDIEGLLTASGSVLTEPRFIDTLFYRTSAGCFFHAYVDNSYDNMVALYSSNESNPYWRLGIKSFSSNFSGPPSVGYVQAENGEAGIYATADSYAAITYVNGFWVGHQGSNLLNASIDDGLIVFNQTATAVPLTVQSAAAQSANLQEWTDYSSAVIASIDTDGQISIDSIRFGDGTVQSTAVSASTENYRTVTSNSYLSTNDGIVFVSCSGSTVELSLPSASGVGGTKITIKRKAGGGDNLVKILPSGSETLDSSNSHSMVYDNEAITLVSDNLNWFII
jgi:hypothetical protein